MKMLFNCLNHFWFWLKANNGKGHGTHSPFVYSLITEVLNDERNFYAFADIEKCFYSEQSKNNLPKKYNELLFRMVNYYGAKSIVQFGLSNGLQTAYFTTANSNVSIICVEENNQLIKNLQQKLSKLPTSNYTIVNETLEDGINGFITANQKFDYIFLNELTQAADYQNLIEKLKQTANPSSIIVINGIHQLPHPKSIWQKFLKSEDVFIMVDIFQFGIIFYNPNFKQRQHFSIHF